MYTSGQMINYEKYKEQLKAMAAPILASQIPEADIDMSGMLKYAKDCGKKVSDLTDEEKNNFIKGDTCETLQKKLISTVKYGSLTEWNEAHAPA